MNPGEFDLLKLRTVEAFTPSLDRWLRDCAGNDPAEAFAALAMWFGHALGGAAVHLGLDHIPRLALSAGELVTENMADDIAAQTFERSP